MSSSKDNEGIHEKGDLEAAKPTLPAEPSFDGEAHRDSDLVTWKGPDDPDNPKNWSKSVKWKNTWVISLFVFMSPVSSSMIAPAMQELGRDLGMHSEIEIYLSMAIFILAYAIGPIFFGPASELYGRVRLLQISNVCDMWTAEERGKAMGVYTLGPLLGPVIGPIAGGFIAQYSTWRWVFWATSAAAVVVQAVGLIGLRECHPGTLLRKRRDFLVQQTGKLTLHKEEVTETLAYKLLHAFQRPIRLFATQPIVFCMAVYMAYLFGVTYLMLATFPDVWTAVYHESPSIGGLNYLSIATGSFAGLFFNLKLVDQMYRTLKARNNGIGKPEYRMPSLAVGSVISTIGLFWYGWSIGHTHWIMPNIGALIFTAGTISCLQGMQTYIVDSYQTYAASAMAACAILRSLCGFAFPLLAPYMYASLGYGWGTSVLAFITMAIGWTTPVVFWTFGHKIRALSRYAAG
ncbi:major facilitator superfamily domain-containing protein [Aspergillus floccosus]